MIELFLSILNMSVKASWLILAVILLRFLLKKALKSITWMLWILVAIKMIIPFSFESMFSLMPKNQSLPTDILELNHPMIQSGVEIIDNTINPILSVDTIVISHQHVDFIAFLTTLACLVWLFGVLSMLVYCVVSYVKLQRQVQVSLHYKDNAYFCDDIVTPFVLGVLHPKVYIPSFIEKEYIDSVLAHENSHLKRKDHIWKMIGYLLLTLHWFNPLAWIAYVLFGRDIELACDELVIMEMEDDNKKEYCSALVSLSDQKRLLLICPLAFGEIGVKERIKTIANYKKPAFWLVIISCALCLCACIGFMSDPLGDNTMKITDINDGAHFEKVLDDVTFVEVGSDKYSYTVIYDEDKEALVETLKSLKLAKTAVSDDRSRERFTSNYIYLAKENACTKIYFNANLKEVWVDNGINVSLTYSIENVDALETIFSGFSTTAGKVFESNLSDFKAEVIRIEGDESLIVYDSKNPEKEIEILTKTRINGKDLFRIGEKVRIVYTSGHLYEYNGKYRVYNYKNIYYWNDITTFTKNYGTSTYYPKYIIDRAMERCIKCSNYYYWYGSKVELYYDEEQMLNLWKNEFGDIYSTDNMITIFTRIFPSRTLYAYQNLGEEVFDGTMLTDGHHTMDIKQLK